MPYIGPSETVQESARRTRRLYGRSTSVRPVSAESLGVTAESAAELDTLLASVTLVDPPPSFAIRAMARVEQSRRRMRALRIIRIGLALVVLAAGLAAGTGMLVTALRSADPQIVNGLARILSQLAAIPGAVLLAIRVIVRTLPGHPTALLAAWAAVAILVGGLWIKALAAAQPDGLRIRQRA
ncbi:MAG: hypothetical protein GXX94_11630 [Chloroflexi bacterium]|mgnify:CR=1 FL=1|nr:hypothetical protein [Chloroflexota bacterium]